MPEAGLELFARVAGSEGESPWTRVVCDECRCRRREFGRYNKGMSDARFSGDNPRWAGRWVRAREQPSAIYAASRDGTRDFFADSSPGATAFLGTVMGTLHVLFLEVSGLIFFALA